MKQFKHASDLQLQVVEYPLAIEHNCRPIDPYSYLASKCNFTKNQLQKCNFMKPPDGENSIYRKPAFRKALGE